MSDDATDSTAIKVELELEKVELESRLLWHDVKSDAEQYGVTDERDLRDLRVATNIEAIARQEVAKILRPLFEAAGVAETDIELDIERLIDSLAVIVAVHRERDKIIVSAPAAIEPPDVPGG